MDIVFIFVLHIYSTTTLTELNLVTDIHKKNMNYGNKNAKNEDEAKDSFEYSF